MVRSRRTMLTTGRRHAHFPRLADQMTKKKASIPAPVLEHPPQLGHQDAPAPRGTEAHPVVTSPAAEHLNDRMALAAKPNAGEPLSHRNRSKAGRKG